METQLPEPITASIEKSESEAKAINISSQNLYTSPPIDCRNNWPTLPVNSFILQNQYKDCLDRILVPNGLIQDRTAKLAKDYFNSIEDTSKPIVALCVLKGANQFFGDFINELKKLAARDDRENSISIFTEFIRVKSYEGTESTGKIKIEGLFEPNGQPTNTNGENGNVNENLIKRFKNKNILIVEDLIDTGRTMRKLVDLIKSCTPKSVKIATLFLKDTPKAIPDRPIAELTGFLISNEFIIGYGMDYNEQFRDLEHIAVISQVGVERFAE